ncbi:TPA: Fur-regulated protein [Salmonella enterica]|nr:Fur-regulated protein [Salmonella enterica]HDC2560366.1 Fur-regulated protein [Salmonella enterica]
MKNELFVMFITLYDDGISIHTDKGVAGYRLNGNQSIFSGVSECENLFPDKVIFHDHRQKNDNTPS